MVDGTLTDAEGEEREERYWVGAKTPAQGAGVWLCLFHWEQVSS